MPTAELIAALGVEPTTFGREMGELGCAPRPGRVTDPGGQVRQVRGYSTADLRAAVERHRDPYGHPSQRRCTRHTAL